MAAAGAKALVADLRALPGDLGLIEGAEARPYEHGYRYGDGRALAVARPAELDAVRRVLALCARHQVRVVPQGANSGLTGASNPGAEGDQLLLSLERLNRVEMVDAVERTAAAQAGARLSAVNAAASDHGLWLPIDLGADPSIGGMVSTNTGGSRQLRYGGMQQRLLGLEAVLADCDGTVLSDMSGLRKDNSGVDLKQLFVGTGGAFGVVTRVLVELAPVLRRTAAAMIAPSSVAVAPEILARLEARLGERLTAFEGLSRAAAEAALRHHPAIRNPFGADGLPDYMLLVEVGASDPSLDADTLLLDALEGLAVDDAHLIADARIAAPERLWALRHAIGDGLRREGAVIAFDIATARARLPALRSAVVEALSAAFPFLKVCDFGHFGDGGLHLNLVWPNGDAGGDPSSVVPAVRELVYDIVVRGFTGSFSAEHGLGPINLPFYQRYTPPAERRLSAALKRVFDPHGLLGAVDFT